MSLQTIVSNSPLADDVKEALLTELLTDGATDDVVAKIKDALQEYIDSGFKVLGVEADPNDPKVKAAQAAFDEEISAAEAEYNEEMENLSIDAAVIQAKANKDIDTMQISAMKAQMAT
jgi:hypothetical protein